MCSRLLAGEAAGAPLFHGLNAFGVILGREEFALLEVLVVGLRLYRRGQIAPQRRARRLHRERRAFGDLGGECERGRAQCLLGHEPIRQSPREGRLAVDAPTCQKKQARALIADQTRERMGKTEARMDAELDEVGGETG